LRGGAGNNWGGAIEDNSKFAARSVDIRPKRMRKLITKEALISSYLQFSEDSGFISFALYLNG
jgi:hypothetical protein